MGFSHSAIVTFVDWSVITVALYELLDSSAPAFTMLVILASHGDDRPAASDKAIYDA